MRWKNARKDIRNFNNLPTSKKPILYVRNLYKKYPFKRRPVINKISFDVFKRQIHAFIGANGAGKTTTIKSIIGAYSRWSGTILINGIKNTKAYAKKYLGYIPEYTHFPKKMTCYKYLFWMARLSGLKREDAKLKVKQMLEQYNLTKLTRKNVASLSSGQKKQILIIQATIHNPDIIIMDEPTANLDPKARINFFDLLLKLKRQNKAIFISSHNLVELNQYADSITILDGGKIIFSGSITKLIKMYQINEYEIKSSDNKKLISILRQQKIKHKVSHNGQIITVNFDNSGLVNAFLQKVKKTKIILTHFAQKAITLDDIYDKLIKFGSNDTMPEKNYLK